MIQLDDLTPGELEQGAADLRNAACVVDATGHAKDTLVDNETGAVCATGAIDLATSRRRLVRRKYLIPREDRQSGYFAAAFLDDQPTLRRECVAYTLLADFLPTELCNVCDYTATCDCADHVYSHARRDVGAWERVVHYNDMHCTSGELLSNMLVIAAERAEILAADARKMLTGRVLV